MIDKQSPGFSGNFRFLAAGKQLKIKSWDGGGRVIAMSSRNMQAARGGRQSPARRTLVLITKNGDIVLRTYSEESVRKSFQVSGASLSDYTGHDGNWEREPGAGMIGRAATEPGSEGASHRDRTITNRGPRDTAGVTWIHAGYAIGAIMVIGLLFRLLFLKKGRE